LRSQGEEEKRRRRREMTQYLNVTPAAVSFFTEKAGTVRFPPRKERKKNNGELPLTLISANIWSLTKSYYYY